MARKDKTTDHSKCRNSNRSVAAAQRDGRCPTCDGRKELISNFAGKHAHVPCPECQDR
jgi:Zn finger protein HypA/HybF involved in hydrogenase expression